MDQVVADLLPDAEVHVVLDNYSIHKKNADWLAAHPNVTFHYTPTSARLAQHGRNMVWHPHAQSS